MWTRPPSLLFLFNSTDGTRGAEPGLRAMCLFSIEAYLRASIV
jgi:hypothetical protein